MRAICVCRSAWPSTPKSHSTRISIAGWRCSRRRRAKCATGRAITSAGLSPFSSASRPCGRVTSAWSRRICNCARTRPACRMPRVSWNLPCARHCANRAASCSSPAAKSHPGRCRCGCIRRKISACRRPPSWPRKIRTTIYKRRRPNYKRRRPNRKACASAPSGSRTALARAA